MKSTFNSILNRICNALFGDSWDKVLYFSIVTLENSGGGVATVNHSHFYQENGEWLKENAKLDLPKDELPNYLREKLAAAFGEVDITADVEREILARKSTE